MRKKVKVLFLICGICLITAACRPTTSETEETKKTYKELIDSIDLEKDTLSLKFSDMVNVNADVTPQSKYKDGLGIYEFEKEAMSFDTRGFIDRLNQYFGREEVFYEDSLEYLIETNAKSDEWKKYKVGGDVSKDGSSLTWSSDVEEYGPFRAMVADLLANRYPIYYTESELMEGEIKKLTSLFSDEFRDIENGHFRYIIINGEKDYKRIEDIYRKINIGLGENETDHVFDCYVNLTKPAREQKEVYGVTVCETIGTEKLPVLFMNKASYKNYDKKAIPETSRKGMADEVQTPVYNYICAIFDNLGNLQSVHMEKYVRIRDIPERVEHILDLRQVLDIIYEKVKDVKRPVNIYSIQLGYTGVVQEEGNGLEDYVYPVWEIQYYDSGPQTIETVYLDAVTGREL